MIDHIEINGHPIGSGKPAYIIAEMSANHNRDFDQAVRILHAAKAAGADALKLQTYRPDTMTIPCGNAHFQIGEGTLWAGRSLYDLYKEAFTPWEWQPKLKAMADDLEIDLFSSAFDASAVAFLEEMGVPAHKVASFEITDIPLIEKMASTGKPLILSTGMADLGEIEDALQAARNAGATEIALLKCTSAYPASPEEINLRTIPHLSQAFNVTTGLSDHTMGIAVPVAAVALGARIVEKHLTLSRSDPGPDAAFSLEPDEFKAMVEAVRTAEKALGEVCYEITAGAAPSLHFRRSLFVVEDIKRGGVFDENNLRSIRPGHGLAPKYLNKILGRRAARDISRGTPIKWEFISR